MTSCLLFVYQVKMNLILFVIRVVFYFFLAQNKTLHTIYNSEYPASRFGLFEDGPFLVTDMMLTSFLSKLEQFWQPKKGGKIESKGNRYELGDFVIKVGIVTVGPNTKGVAIEVSCILNRYALACY